MGTAERRRSWWHRGHANRLRLRNHPRKAIIAGATKGPDDDAQPIAATHPSPAPKPATLGMLALGAPGLSIWRREDPVAATANGN